MVVTWWIVGLVPSDGNMLLCGYGAELKIKEFNANQV